MDAETLKAWLPVIGALAAALVAAAATTTVGLLGFRRSGQTVNLEAEKVNLTDRQYQTQREEMVTEITERMGKMYNSLLKDANESIDRLRRDNAELHEKYGEVKAGLLECEAREAVQRARIDRMEQLARAQGWDLA